MKPLNAKQLSAMWTGIALMVAMGSYPPWKEGGSEGNPANFAPLFAPPHAEVGKPGFQIDFSRLGLMWAMAAIMTIGLIVSRQDGAGRPSEKPSGGQIPGSQSANASQALANDAHVAHVLIFPNEKSLGDLLLDSPNDPDYWELFGPAQGIVKVPKGQRVQLEIAKDNPVDLSKLSLLPDESIYSLDLSGSKVKDKDFVHIERLSALAEIDVSETGISDEALDSLSRIKSLRRIWLDGTGVTKQGIIKLASLDKLKKVSLVDTKIDQVQLADLPEQFKMRCQFVFSSIDKS